MTEVFTVTDGYDRNKTKRQLHVRRLTLDEIKALSGRVHFIANDGTLRQLTINGRVRTWKRDANRIEVPVKYGMREYATFDTAEALQRLVKVIPEHVCSPVLNSNYYGMTPTCHICDKPL